MNSHLREILLITLCLVDILDVNKEKLELKDINRFKYLMQVFEEKVNSMDLTDAEAEICHILIKKKHISSDIIKNFQKQARQVLRIQKYI